MSQTLTNGNRMKTHSTHHKTNSNLTGQICATCGRKETIDIPLKQCSKCKQVRYCDKDCQSADWANHKSYCIEKEREMKEANGPYMSRFKQKTPVYPKNLAPCPCFKGKEKDLLDRSTTEVCSNLSCNILLGGPMKFKAYHYLCPLGGGITGHHMIPLGFCSSDCEIAFGSVFSKNNILTL